MTEAKKKKRFLEKIAVEAQNNVNHGLNYEWLRRKVTGFK